MTVPDTLLGTVAAGGSGERAARTDRDEHPGGIEGGWSRRPVLGVLAPLALVAVLAMLGGCAHVGHDATHDATLSDAMREAKKPKREQRVLPAGHDEPEEEPEEQVDLREGTTCADTVAARAGEGTASPSGPSSRPGRKHYGVIASLGDHAGHRLSGFGACGILIGEDAGARTRVDLSAACGQVDTRPSDPRAAGIKGVSELGGEVSVRRYLTSDHTLVGAYAMLGLRGGWLFFDFAHPLSVEEGGKIETVKSDIIGFGELLLGLGIAPLQLRHLQIGVNACWGFRQYAGDTYEGFANDAFHPAGSWRLQFELSTSH